MDEQFDALLYLGLPSPMTTISVLSAWCADADFVKRRVERLTRFAPL